MPLHLSCLLWQHDQRDVLAFIVVVRLGEAVAHTRSYEDYIHTPRGELAFVATPIADGMMSKLAHHMCLPYATLSTHIY